MNILLRIKRVTIGRIEQFLARVEDPEVIFPQLVEEMAGQLGNAVDAEASALAGAKRAERDAAKARERVDRMGNGAALALTQGDEKTAREAVAAQIAAEQELERFERQLDCAQGGYESARSTREYVQEQLQELHSRKDEILTRARVAKSRRKVQQTVQGSTSSADSILDSVARMEAAVEAAEAELEIQQTLTGSRTEEGSLERRLLELGRQAEIEHRLSAMRAELEASSET